MSPRVGIDISLAETDPSPAARRLVKAPAAGHPLPNGEGEEALTPETWHLRPETCLQPIDFSPQLHLKCVT